jgi:hypothetical protein
MAKAVRVSQQTWKKVNRLIEQGGIDQHVIQGAIRNYHSINVAARNEGNTDIAIFDVIALDNILITEQTALLERKYGFSVRHAAQSTSNAFGVALMPIAIGAIGKVAIFGHSVVKVNLTSSSHSFGVPSITSNGILNSADTGPFQLIYKAGESGLVNCVAVFPLAASSIPRRAFCKTDAGSGGTIVCYLDTDETGQEVTVTCKLSRANNLNECFPLLQNGEEIAVYFDSNTATWRSFITFIGQEACA